LPSEISERLLSDAIQSGYSSGSAVYNYGLDPRSERLSLNSGGSFVFFSAQFSGGGSGTLDSPSILEYESGGKIVNLLPFVGVTNQSEGAVSGLSRRYPDFRFW
jgi:hypothetical protein